MKRAWTLGVLAAAALCAGCVDGLVGTDPPNTPAGVFDVVWHDFDRNYALFPVKAVDWNAAYAQFKPQADSAVTLDSVAPVIGAMFASLHDLHVDLTVPGGTRYTSVNTSTIHTYFNPGTSLLLYLAGTTLSPSGKMRYGRITATTAQNIGYVWIPSFAGSQWASEIDGVLQALGSVSGLVIDLRDNGGGSTDNSGALAARFVSQTRDYAYVRFRNGPAHADLTDYRARTVGPSGKHTAARIVVLTNRLCASATEDFLLALRLEPGVVFVGDTTAGALGNPLIRTLPNGWEYRMPQWIEYDAEKRVVENVGIGPDIYVRMTRSDSLNLRDPQLLRAIKIAAGGS